MLVMIAIIITLTIMVMTMSVKTLEAFFRFFYCVDIQDRLFAPISPPTLKRIPAVIDVSQASTSHLCALNIKQGLVLWYEKSL